MSHKLINDPSKVVEEMLDGLVQSHSHLSRLDGFPEIKVVVDATFKKDRVAVISGGGSGHEPAHAGFVGDGMLAAAVCGDVFASPSAEAVLAAILAVSGPAGCVLIVKNYTGDRLNFGIAAEQAKSMGVAVEMVIVGDDCGVPLHGIAGARGLAGTVFVHKVAGQAAKAGLSVDEVAAEARAAAASMATMGVALTVCTLPGHPPSTRLQAGEMEMGLGIHGEPGVEKVNVRAADEVMDDVVARIAAHMQLQPSTQIAVLVNNLGATTAMEMFVACRRVIATLTHTHKACVVRVYTGALMTSLDMAGLSVTLLKTDDVMLQRLDAPTLAPAWPSCEAAVYDANKRSIPLPPAITSHAEDAPAAPAQTQHGMALQRCIESAAQRLIAAEKQLEDWDSKVGDGDCGQTFRRGGEALLHALRNNTLPCDDVAAAAQRIALIVRRSMGGTSGAMYDIMFTAAAAALKNDSEYTQQRGASMAACSHAFAAGVRAISLYGGASRGDRTMLDALLPAVQRLEAAATAGSSAKQALQDAADAAMQGARSTADMHARAGRSSYIAQNVLASIPDPGAMAAAFWLEAVAATL